MSKFGLQKLVPLIRADEEKDGKVYDLSLIHI